LKKPLTGGDKLPDGTGWKDFNINRILKGSFSGYAFTVFINAASQAE